MPNIEKYLQKCSVASSVPRILKIFQISHEDGTITNHRKSLRFMETFLGKKKKESFCCQQKIFF